MARRRPGTLLPLEIDILRLAVEERRSGDGWIHGFALAKQMQEAGASKRLTAHGTLYKALGRLDSGGLLEDRWEDPEAALAEGRPRRRLYRVTAEGEAALARATAEENVGTGRVTPGVAPA
ncbi:MAG: helix-turn-helix transcriptional regulator [Acidimicrobiia bacterium]